MSDHVDSLGNQRNRLLLHFASTAFPVFFERDPFSLSFQTSPDKWFRELGRPYKHPEYVFHSTNQISLLSLHASTIAANSVSSVQEPHQVMDRIIDSDPDIERTISSSVRSWYNYNNTKQKQYYPEVTQMHFQKDEEYSHPLLQSM